MRTCGIFFVAALQGIFLVGVKTWKTPESQGFYFNECAYVDSGK
jgi:hypothetical protein